MTAAAIAAVSTFWFGAAASAQTSNQRQIVEQGVVLAQQLLPLEDLTNEEGFSLSLDIPELTRLPLHHGGTGAEIGMKAEDVRMTHRRGYVSFDGLTTVELRATYFEDPTLPTRYIDARLKLPRAQPAAGSRRPALVVRPDIEPDTVRSAFAAEGPVLISVIGRLGDGDTRTVLDLEALVVDLVQRQRPLEGSEEWHVLDSLVDEVQTASETDYSEAQSRAVTLFCSLIVLTAVLGKAVAVVTDRNTRLRQVLAGRRRPVVADPPSPTVVVISTVARRRRLAAKMMTARRWLFAIPMLLAVLVTTVDVTTALGSGQSIPIRVVLVSALVFATFNGAGRLIRRFADAPAAHLGSMYDRPAGYGKYGAVWSLPFIVISLLTLSLVSVGLGAVFIGFFAELVKDNEAVSLDPRGQAWGEIDVGFILGLILLALARSPLNWLRSKINVSLNLSAESDKRQATLFLRSFGADKVVLHRQLTQQRSVLDRMAWGFRVSFEDVVVGRLWLRGPVVAIGKPGSNAPALGATRSYFGSDWQSAIRQALDRCQLVAMSLGDTPGVRWELDQIVSRQVLGRALFIIPPTADSIENMALIRSTLGIPNPPPNGLEPLIITVDPQRHVATYFCDRYRTESAYGAALDAAVYHLLGPAISEVPQVATPDERLHRQPVVVGRQTAAVPARQRQRLGVKARTAVLTLIAGLFIFVFVAQLAMVYPGASTAPVDAISLPSPPYSSVGSASEPGFVWGADYLASPNRFVVHQVRPKSVAYSAEFDMVAVVDREGEISIRDGLTGSPVRSINPGLKGARSATWSGPDLYVTYPDERLVLRLTEDGSPISIGLDYVPLFIGHVGDHLVVAAADPSLYLYDEGDNNLLSGQKLQSNEPLFLVPVGERLVVKEYPSNGLHEVLLPEGRLEAISPTDGIAVATGPNSFAVWNTWNLVQYSGQPFEQDRHTRLREPDEPNPGELIFTDGEILVMVDDDGHGEAYLICDGHLCTFREASSL